MAGREPPLKQISLTREGWLFVVILGFITVGAVLRNVNLLILMAGIMFAPLIINWRLGVLRLKTLSAKRSLPNRIHAGELASFQWICHNDSRISAWNVEVRDIVRRDDPGAEESANIKKSTRFWNWVLWLFKLDKARRSNAKVAIVQIAAGKSEVGAYRVYFAQRGRYLCGPAKLTTTFPFGLISSQITIPKTDHFYVAPTIGRLSPSWEQRVRSSVVGSDAIKRKRGLEEDEFYALRPWRSGDSKKNIHWRTSARFGQPIVKQHDQQDNRDFALLLDLHLDEPDSTSEFDEFDQTISQLCEDALKFGTTVLLKAGNAVQGRIAIAVCGQDSVVCRSRNHREIVNESMQYFAIAQPSAQPKIADSLLQIASSVSASTPIYVISSRELPAENGYQTLLDWERREPEVQPDSSPDSMPEGDSDATGTPQIITKQRMNRQLKAIWPSVRWVSTSSDEFQSMFSSEQDDKSKTLSKLADRWNSKNVTS